MKIGFLSDTHGNLQCYRKAVEKMRDCDYIIHCGDVLPNYSQKLSEEDIIELGEQIRQTKNILIVKGNGDNNRHEQLLGHTLHHPYLVITLGDYRIFATHGHHYSRMSMIMKAKEEQCHILCYGHTHIKELDKDEELLILNPGSVSLPRDGSRSYAILEDSLLCVYDLDTGNRLGSLSLNNNPPAKELYESEHI